MKHIKRTNLLFISIFTALFANVTSAQPQQQVISFAEECEAFNLSSKCAPPPVVVIPKPIPPRTNFIKDEVVLLYSTESKNKIAQITKRYQLKTKSKAILASAKVGMVVADTNGQNPLNLVKTISQKENKVEASTNNIFKPATIVSKETPEIASKRASGRNNYSLNETGIHSVHKTTKGENVLICMVDTAVDLFHPSLSNALIETLDLVELDLDDIETQVHGTSIAGVLVSQNKHIGIAPKAKLLAISAFGMTKNRPFILQSASSNIAKAIDRCIRQKADVINLSFTGGKDALVERMIKSAITKGITVVSAGGNGGHSGSTIYPALIPGVLTATAVDQNKNLYNMANKGRFIDFAAPGVNILTIAPQGKYQISTGTSLAAAHISGVAALLISRQKNTKVEQALTQTALDLGKPGRDQEFGEGLISANRALSQLKKQ